MFSAEMSRSPTVTAKMAKRKEYARSMAPDTRVGLQSKSKGMCPNRIAVGDYKISDADQSNHCKCLEPRIMHT